MSAQDFRVIIVGGSVAGLALALMLEKHGIDFIVLEAYPSIAPQVGASIGILPNGLRVLDQLGCYEDLLKKAQYPVNTVSLRDSSGNPLIQVQDVDSQSIGRHGYPMIFFQRRMLIQILYDHIQAKTNVLTSTRVKSIHEDDQGVSVETQDGRTFTGHVVVGADGVHSVVRKEIWRIESENGLVKRQILENDIQAKYGCIFGISTGITGLPKGLLQFTAGQRTSILTASGPEDDTYWALFYDLGETYYGAGSPRLGKVDEHDVIAKHQNDAVTEEMTLADLYSKKTVSVCTPLHEYVVQAWHSQRSIVIGDAAHKFNPLTGQGGNSAIESAAALTNEIVKLLQAYGPNSLPPMKAFRSAFEAVQSTRSHRASTLVKSSTRFQKLTAMETSVHRAILNHVLPHFSQNLMLRLLFRAYLGAVSLDSLEIPERPRSIPYDDEVSFNTSVRSKTALLTTLTLLFGLSLLGVALLHKVSAMNGTWDLVAEAVSTGFIPEAGLPLESISCLSVFPRIAWLFRTLTAIFLGVVSGSTNDAHPIQACYFLLAFFPPILLMMMVEAHRKSNRGSLLQRSALWVGAAQLFGLGIVLPLYFALSLFRSQHAANWGPNAHSVSLTSRTALPALIIGYVVPSVWMFALANHSRMKQPAIAFWQISPVIAVILAEAFHLSSSTGRLLHKGKDNTSGDALQSPGRSRKLPSLTTAYNAITIASALVHIFTVSFLAFSSSHSLLKTFIPQRPLEPVSTIADGMYIFLQFDLLLCVGATMIYSVVTLDSMRHYGMTGATLLSSMALIATGYVVVGPGASTLVLWRWREKAIEKASAQHHKRA